MKGALPVPRKESAEADDVAPPRSIGENRLLNRRYGINFSTGLEQSRARKQAFVPPSLS